MSRYERNKVEYIVMCVFLYADRKGLPVKRALRYLLDGKGIAHLEAHYDIEHTLPVDDTLDALDAICQRNCGAPA